MSKCPTPASKPAAKSSTKCRLVEEFWGFWPAFQRWADSQTPPEAEGLTPQRTRILACLQERGPQIMSALKDELGVTATNITALVDALEGDGLVQRKPHASDRRATVIEMTAKANCELMKRGCSDYRERVGDLFSALPEPDRKELLRIMGVLRERLQRG